MERELAAIRERNVRVEADKAWETSPVRIVSIVVTTYLIAAVVLSAIGNDSPSRNALIPALGYLLSTLSLGFVRNTVKQITLKHFQHPSRKMKIRQNRNQ
ncbi:MAG: hypothetical protein HGA38_01205 [Candidatus Moranbacteria bacterium]|nr:hypothetical protein [Candidatus Moranbacteria bacterium]NTW45626.1 hypothetical protein [Candidatus Moranbacteria bacterium]